MPINVFPWPPVGVAAAEWTEDAPVARIRSMLTGREQIQGSQRKRRIASLQVSALANGRMGAGYCEMLKQLLDGGIHAVRLKSSPINWHLDEIQRQGAGLNSYPLLWRTGSNPLAWQAGSGPNPLSWFTGTIAIAGAVTATGLAWFMPVTGLPPNTLVARPGDHVRIYHIADAAVSEVVRVLRPATTNAAGVVTLKIDRQPAISGGRVNMAGQDEAVFRVDGALPRSIQTVGADWTYQWNFREVFADEVGGFTERAGIWT